MSGFIKRLEKNVAKIDEKTHLRKIETNNTTTGYNQKISNIPKPKKTII